MHDGTSQAGPREHYGKVMKHNGMKYYILVLYSYPTFITNILSIYILLFEDLTRLVLMWLILLVRDCYPGAEDIGMGHEIFVYLGYGIDLSL